jgi:hypothetical protein
VNLCLIGFAIFCYCFAATITLHNSMALKGKSYQSGSKEKLEGYDTHRKNKNNGCAVYRYECSITWQ